uniref:Tetratricopeptide repeat domain 39A n=1 Tax=Xiphophorus couchianus TaxID=32473 RepID=A0A3B5MMI1_9TELE
MKAHYDCNTTASPPPSHFGHISLVHLCARLCCSSSEMTLQASLDECMEALDLFLNNHFNESLERLRPRVQESMYHALIYATVLEMQAMMTFQQDDISNAGNTMKSAQEVCQRSAWSTRFFYVSSLKEKMTLQLHAEVCYAECQLQRAALTFLQDESMVSFIKGGIKVRNSYMIYKDLHNFIKSYSCVKGPSHIHLEGGISFGVGAFNLNSVSDHTMCECSPFSRARTVTMVTLLLPCLPRLNVKCLISTVSSCFLTVLLCGAVSPCCQAVALFEDGCKAQQTWKQFHHMCYWELMWCFTFKRAWKMAYFYADLLSQESRWSKAMYVYMKAAYLSMLPEEEARPFGEDEVELFRQVPTLKQKIAGKSPPTEKFAIRKARRYKSSNPVRLPVPVLEMMYMWNGFSMISKRPELTEGMMQTLVEAERTLLESPEHEYLIDDRCLIHMLKGLCFKNQGILQAAEECFNKVCSRWADEKKIKFDHYLVPNALVELSLLYIDQGRRDAAIKILHKAKHNYKDYSMESRTLFRIHAALAKLKADPEEEDSQM